MAEADNRGYASRATVYAIGAYRLTRSLNGFTKPVRRMMRELIAGGLIPPEAANPMKPEY